MEECLSSSEMLTATTSQLGCNNHFLSSFTAVVVHHDNALLVLPVLANEL